MQKIYTALATFLTANLITAQDLGLTETSKGFWEDIKGAAPYILVIVFIVSIFFNIGKLQGEKRDYAAFFAGVGLWLGGLLLVSAIITFILNKMDFGG